MVIIIIVKFVVIYIYIYREIGFIFHLHGLTINKTYFDQLFEVKDGRVKPNGHDKVIGIHRLDLDVDLVIGAIYIYGWGTKSRVSTTRLRMRNLCIRNDWC